MSSDETPGNIPLRQVGPDRTLRLFEAEQQGRGSSLAAQGLSAGGPIDDTTPFELPQEPDGPDILETSWPPKES